VDSCDLLWTELAVNLKVVGILVPFRSHKFRSVSGLVKTGTVVGKSIEKLYLFSFLVYSLLYDLLSREVHSLITYPSTFVHDFLLLLRNLLLHSQYHLGRFRNLVHKSINFRFQLLVQQPVFPNSVSASDILSVGLIGVNTVVDIL